MNTAILKKAFQVVKTTFPKAKPSCTIILGSGWGSITSSFKTRKSLEYRKIPGLGNPSVEGHAGQLLLSDLSGMQALIFQGRRHWYEGDGWEPIAIPVYISLKLGVSFLLLTNAAGGIRKGMKPGDLMIIDDHINAMGNNPLIGNADTIWGPKFADQTQVYDPILRKMLRTAGRRKHIPLTHGIYAATSGPTYETPAETRLLSMTGADAVGMSTVPEATLANAAGLRVAGISCITNTTAHTGNKTLTHKKVIDAVAKAQPVIKVLLTEFLKEVAANVSNLRKQAC